MALVHVTACSGQVDEAFALLEPMLESLELIDPLGELSFVLSGTAQWLVFIEQWAPARKMFNRIISAARTAGAPAVLTFPLALFSEFELWRGKIAAAYAVAADRYEREFQAALPLYGDEMAFERARALLALGMPSGFSPPTGPTAASPMSTSAPQAQRSAARSARRRRPAAGVSRVRTPGVLTCAAPPTRSTTPAS
jgi:hypothetical protein